MKIGAFLNTFNTINTLSVDKAQFHLQNFTASQLAPLKKDVFQKTNVVSFKALNTQFSDYEDTENFSHYYEAKLKKDLKSVSEKDIAKLISEVAKETKTDIKKVKEVVGKITQFSSYNSLPVIGQKMLDAGVTNLYNWDNLSLHKVLNYAGILKKQFAFNETYKKQIKPQFGIFVDDFILSDMKKLKEKHPLLFCDLQKNIKNGKIKLLNIDGFNINLDGKYVSYGMFSKNIGLKELTKKVLEKAQKNNISVDEALNGDIKQKVKEVFGKEVECVNISADNDKSLSLKDIAERMNQRVPVADSIKSTIDYIVKKHSEKLFVKEDENVVRAIIGKYLDTQTKVYSSDTFADDLKKQHESIEKQVKQIGKTMDDVVYLIPNPDKSFSLISYQYAKINDIPQDKFINYSGFGDPVNVPDLDGKVAVIFDDFSGSGLSLCGQEFHYGTVVANFPDLNVIFAPVTALNMGYEYLNNSILDFDRINKDFVITQNVINHDIEKFIPSGYRTYFDAMSDTKREQMLSACLNQKQFSKASIAAVALPYMIPDNCSNTFGLIFKSFLNNNFANKPRVNNREKEI